MADEQWARILELELVPHPGITWSKAIEADYGMQDGVVRVKVRAAVAGYILRRWSIDSSPDHSLDPVSHHLWLRNPQTLYGKMNVHNSYGFKTMAAYNESTNEIWNLNHPLSTCLAQPLFEMG